MLFLVLLLAGYSTQDVFKDPELDLTVPELIQYYLYPVEEHNVTTQDGYILTHHRIPTGRDTRPAPFTNENERPVVIFVHGLFSDSSNFVLNPPTSSAGYMFADAGFDVWLLNCRGTKYSLNHEFMSSKDKGFWKFSWYDMGMRDVTDTVDYILNLTGQDSVYYVGHSQGTTVGFVRLADDPNGEFGKKIRQFHALGPNGGMEYTLNPQWRFIGLDPIYNFLEGVYNFVGGLRLDLPPVLQEIVAEACLTPFYGKAILELITLFPPLPERNGQFNASRADIYLKNFPGTTSLLNVVHFLQLIHFHDLRKLDLGRHKNREVYGSDEPPVLNMGNITTPTYLYYSDDDWIATAHDARNHIIDKYGPGLKGHTNLDHFTHFDFAVGLRAPEEIYRPIIRLMYEDLEERAKLQPVASDIESIPVKTVLTPK